MWCFPLCDEFPAWPTEPTVLDASKKAPGAPKLNAYRVIFPRRFLNSVQWDLAVKKPATLVANAFPAVSFRCYGWHHNVAANEEAIIGFCKMTLPEATKCEPLKQSGMTGVFFQLMIPKKVNSTSSGYLSRIMRIRWNISTPVVKKPNHQLLGWSSAEVASHVLAC